MALNIALCLSVCPSVRSFVSGGGGLKMHEGLKNVRPKVKDEKCKNEIQVLDMFDVSAIVYARPTDNLLQLLTFSMLLNVTFYSLLIASVNILSFKRKTHLVAFTVNENETRLFS